MVQNRLDEQVETREGNKTVTKPKHTIESALNLKSSKRLITTTEQAVAMGFILMKDPPKQA